MATATGSVNGPVTSLPIALVPSHAIDQILLPGGRVAHTQLQAMPLMSHAVFHVGALGVAGSVYFALQAQLNAAKASAG